MNEWRWTGNERFVRVTSISHIKISRAHWKFFTESECSILSVIKNQNRQLDSQTGRDSESVCAECIDGPGSSSGSDRGLRKSNLASLKFASKTPAFLLSRCCTCPPVCLLCLLCQCFMPSILASPLACLSAGPLALAACHHRIYEVLETSHSNAIISVIYTSHLCTSYTYQPLIEYKKKWVDRLMIHNSSRNQVSLITLVLGESSFLSPFRNLYCSSRSFLLWMFPSPSLSHRQMVSVRLRETQAIEWLSESSVNLIRGRLNSVLVSSCFFLSLLLLPLI